MKKIRLPLWRASLNWIRIGLLCIYILKYPYVSYSIYSTVCLSTFTPVQYSATSMSVKVQLFFFYPYLALQGELSSAKWNFGKETGEQEWAGEHLRPFNVKGQTSCKRNGTACGCCLVCQLYLHVFLLCICENLFVSVCL